MTAKYGPRLVKKERCDYLRPTVILCDSPDKAIAKKEYMFPFAPWCKCPQEKMLEEIGPTLVCSAITEDAKFQRALIDATHIDRLNIGPIPTIKLNWLQPHEGSIVDFLFRRGRSSSRGRCRSDDREQSAGQRPGSHRTIRGWILSETGETPMNVTLTPDLEQIVARKVASGAFSTPVEVIRASLQLMEEEEEKQKELEELRCSLRIAIDEGDRGLSVPLTPELIEEIWQEGLAQLEAEGKPQ